MIAIADLKAGHIAPQPVWSQHPQTTKEAEDAKARRGQQALRLTPLSDPAALPMMPPGTRLLAFVSLDHSWDRSATWMVGETSWLFSLATFARSESGTSSAHRSRGAEGGAGVDRGVARRESRPGHRATRLLRGGWRDPTAPASLPLQRVVQRSGSTRAGSSTARPPDVGQGPDRGEYRSSAPSSSSPSPGVDR